MLNGNWINFTEGTDQDIIGRIRVDVWGCVSLIADDDHRILQDNCTHWIGAIKLNHQLGSPLSTPASNLLFGFN